MVTVNGRCAGFTGGVGDRGNECYPHTGNDGLSWRMSSRQPWSVGLSIRDEAMDVGSPRHRELTTIRVLVTCSFNWD